MGISGGPEGFQKGFMGSFSRNFRGVLGSLRSILGDPRAFQKSSKGHRSLAESLMGFKVGPGGFQKGSIGVLGALKRVSGDFWSSLGPRECFRRSQGCFRGYQRRFRGSQGVSMGLEGVSGVLYGVSEAFQ